MSNTSKKNMCTVTENMLPIVFFDDGTMESYSDFN